MGTVTTLPRGRPLTRRDLEAMPDDGRRYELVDGSLIVTPAPSPLHQIVQPDLLVAHRSDFTDHGLPVAPLLAVEVLSPTAHRVDLTLKGGEYAERVHVAAEQSHTCTAPFEVTIVPARLLGS